MIIAARHGCYDVVISAPNTTIAFSCFSFSVVFFFFENSFLFSFFSLFISWHETRSPTAGLVERKIGETR